MADICEPLAGATNLDPHCRVLKKPGGIAKYIYLFSLSQLESYSRSATTKELNTLVLKTGEKLLKFNGKKLSNSSKGTMEQTATGPSYTHGGTFLAYFNTQAEKETIEAVGVAEDLVLIVVLNSGQIEVHGMISDSSLTGLAEGLTMSIPTGGSGTALTDSSASTLEFTGTSDKLPIYASFGATGLESIAYLEALVATTP